jgi:hypothetical protein
MAWPVPKPKTPALADTMFSRPNAQQVVPRRYWRGPGPQTRAPARDYTGATRPPERDAEASTTPRIKWAGARHPVS